MSNWTDRSTHKAFFEHLAKVFDIHQSSDWHNVKKEDIYKHGGQNLLQMYYNDSIYQVHNAHDNFMNGGADSLESSTRNSTLEIRIECFQRFLDRQSKPAVNTCSID